MSPSLRLRANTVHRVSRWIHVYTSMFALVVVVFFAATGVTLNHPDAFSGADPVQTNVSGTVPFDVLGDDGTPKWLDISEYVRSEHDISGSVSDYTVVGTEGTISYKNPGYSADLLFDTEDNTYELHAEQQGLIAVLNDLHKGRDSGSAWSWVIDVSAILLVLIAFSGTALQLFLRKRRKSALAVAGVGTIISVVLMFVAVS